MIWMVLLIIGLILDIHCIWVPGIQILPVIQALTLLLCMSRPFVRSWSRPGLGNLWLRDPGTRIGPGCSPTWQSWLCHPSQRSWQARPRLEQVSGYQEQSKLIGDRLIGPGQGWNSLNLQADYLIEKVPVQRPSWVLFLMNLILA